MDVPIKDYPGYTVSDEGYITGPRGKRLAPQLTNGYERVMLYNKNGKRKARVHLLVIEAFIGPRPAGMEAAHNDGNRRNNNISNLEWKTPRANADDKRKHGTMPRDETNGQTKLPRDQVPQIIEKIHQGRTAAEVAAEHGITAGHARRIYLGKRRVLA